MWQGRWRQGGCRKNAKPRRKLWTTSLLKSFLLFASLTFLSRPAFSFQHFGAFCYSFYLPPSIFPTQFSALLFRSSLTFSFPSLHSGPLKFLVPTSSPSEASFSIYAITLNAWSLPRECTVTKQHTLSNKQVCVSALEAFRRSTTLGKSSTPVSRIHTYIFFSICRKRKGARRKGRKCEKGAWGWITAIEKLLQGLKERSIGVEANLLPLWTCLSRITCT